MRRKSGGRSENRFLHRPLASLGIGPCGTRTETDSFGPIEVPADRYWGAQTERSRNNFRIGEERMPRPLIAALAIVKRAAAETNLELGSLDARRAKAICRRRRKSSTASSTTNFRFRSGRPAPAPRPT